MAQTTTIERRLTEARRLYNAALVEDDHIFGNLENAKNGFRAACDRLLTVIEAQASEIARLEREVAPLIKPQPKGVKAGCFDI